MSWCIPCDDGEHHGCAAYDPAMDCECARVDHRFTEMRLPPLRGMVMSVFDGDWNARCEGNRMWDLVDRPLDDIPPRGSSVILVADPGGPRQMGEAMLATVHDIRRPEANPAAGWVVIFDWLVEHTCH